MLFATDEAKTEELAARLADALGDLAERIVPTTNPRARRISLRLDPAGHVVLVRPRGVSPKAATRFAVEMRGWIEAQLSALPPRIDFRDGAVVPFLGADHLVRHAPAARRGVWREDGVIYVSGAAEHLARRLRDWLKGEAKALLTPMSRTMAEALGCKVTRVSVRDTRSRWGSCSVDGKLSFSWRLILAPKEVLVYVAAHEVAHLKHLDHSRAFWRAVDETLSSYGAAYENPGAKISPRSARQWLRRRGTSLHSYG